jgi:NADPH-dependent curcumin reductase CurA
MERGVNRQWRIAHRPAGLAQSSDFEWTEVPVPHPGPGEALVQNKLLSGDHEPPVDVGERDVSSRAEPGRCHAWHLRGHGR